MKLTNIDQSVYGLYRMAFLWISLMLALSACSGNNNEQTNESEAKHRLYMPAKGIQSLMESNSQKTLDGTDGPVVIQIGEVNRKKADIGVRRKEHLLDERILSEKESMTFRYEGHVYTIEVKQIKKPLLGSGKVELHIH